MTDTIMISKVIRINIDQIVETGDSIEKTEVGLGMNKIIGVMLGSAGSTVLYY